MKEQIKDASHTESHQEERLIDFAAHILSYFMGGGITKEMRNNIKTYLHFQYQGKGEPNIPSVQEGDALKKQIKELKVEREKLRNQMHDQAKESLETARSISKMNDADLKNYRNSLKELFKILKPTQNER